MLALQEYEDGQCPGCGLQLAETTLPEHELVYYEPGDAVRCHACAVQAAKVAEYDEDPVRSSMHFTPPRKRGTA